MNTSFVELLEDCSLDELKRRIRVVHSTRQINDMLKSTLERASGHAGRRTGLFSLRSAELTQGLFMQDPNLSQVSLRFMNVMPYGVQPFPDCNLAGMIQRGFKALDATCSKSGKGISLLYFSAG